MKTFEDISRWIRYRDELIRCDRPEIGFVPTMGALHEGHLTLVRTAKRENDKVLVSLFINPTQFNNAEDLLKYPRDINRDLALLEKEGVDYVLAPNTQQMYADRFRFKLNEDEFSKDLCGVHRQGHFTGVLTVVMKLLNLAQAKRCYMGEKDYQQFLLVRDMAAGFFMPTEIIPCPTVREKSGLAMSSRNERLSPEGRAKAANIYKTLTHAKTATEAQSTLEELGFTVDYVKDTMGRRFAAATIEDVRLIDNVSIN